MITRKCLGFLQRTIDVRLHLVAQNNELISWTDASFAPDGGRSHTGWLITLGSPPVTWRSSRQASVTLSTAEAELAASVEGALALCSLCALVNEVEEDDIFSLILKTDSTSSMAIQHGSGSWRTRHLRIKAAWIAEKVERGELSLEHCAGEVQIADALTKPLASARLRQLSKMMGLLSDTDLHQASSGEVGSSSPSMSKILVALLILAQAAIPVKSMEVVPYQPLAVDHSLVVWGVFALIALLWTASWELLKYAGWQLYFTAAPGAGSRRLRRLQRIRDTTATAIQNELDARRRSVADIPVELRRSRSLSQRNNYPTSAGERTESSSRLPTTPVGSGPLTYRANQRDRGVQTTGPSFAPVVPEVRTEVQVRTEVRVPETIHIVPGNQCYHVFNPCHAFRHRGTQGRVQTLRICEYCVRHQGRDPQLPGPGIDQILRLGHIPNFDRPGTLA